MKNYFGCYMMMLGAAMGREMSIAECKLLSEVFKSNAQ